MNEPYILGALNRFFAEYERHGFIAESEEIYKELIGVGRTAKERLLAKYRENYLNLFRSDMELEVAFQIEAAMDQLVVFWDDSSSRYNAANDGIGWNGAVWSLLKTYYYEAINYISQLYRLHLLHPTDELYNIEDKYKGLALTQVHDVIASSGLLSAKRLEQLETKAKKEADKKKGYGGKILGIPWSGEPMVDSISGYFDDSSSLNMTVTTEKGKEFRQVCRKRAQDKTTTKEEKEIWARSVINSLNALYSQANHSNMNRIIELVGEYGAILEEEFMQIPEPICVKKLALEIGAVEIFDDKMLTLGISDDGSAGLCTFNRFLLTEDLGLPTLELYEKRLCKNCEVEFCPYDIYYRKFQEDGVGIPGKNLFSKSEIKTDNPEEKTPDASTKENINMPERSVYLDTLEGEKPKLVPNEIQIMDIPRCNVQEVDNLSLYFDDSEKYAKYYALEAEDSFAKVCWDRIENPRFSKKSNEKWAMRVLQTLDSAYFVAENEKPEIMYMSIVLAVTMEVVFMQVDDPICVKKIGMDNDLTIGIESSIDLHRKKGSQSTPAEEARFEAEYRNIGGNLPFFEKEMCLQCDRTECPYRFLVCRKGGYYLDEIGGEDGTEQIEKQEQPSPVENKESELKALLDEALEKLGEEYAVRAKTLNGEWAFKKSGILLSYLGWQAGLKCGYNRTPWKFINGYIENRSGYDYLKEKASRMRESGVYPNGYEIIKETLDAITLE